MTAAGSLASINLGDAQHTLLKGSGCREKSVKLKNEVLIEIDWGTTNPWPNTITGIDCFSGTTHPSGKLIMHNSLSLKCKHPAVPSRSDVGGGMFDWFFRSYLSV
jgi:hypothetical protein